MLKTGLEFAPGTTDDCKRLVAQLFQPSEILGAYRAARDALKTSDLVLVASESNPSGFNIEPRLEYVGRIRQAMGANASNTIPVLGIAQKSAHGVMRLPFESEALWLVIVRGRDMPVMCVLFTTPYEVAVSAS